MNRTKDVHTRHHEAAGNSPTLVIIADGWTKSVFLDLLEKGELPEIQETLVTDGGLIKNVVSNLPSVSLASHTSILTSSYQEEHHIPGHRWRDANSGKIVNYLSLDGPKLVNAHIAKSVKTIYEEKAFTSGISVQNTITRGATVKRRLLTMRSGPILSQAARYMVENPDSIISAWLPRTDGLAHVHGAGSREVRQDMRDTSKAIGDLADTLGKAGMLENARILFIPDHGHRDTKKNVRLGPVLAGSGYDFVINPRNYDGRKQVVLTSGDSSAQVYLNKKLLNERPNIADAIKDKPELELICWQSDGVWHFTNRLGKSMASWSGDKKVRYSVVEGDDPLGLSVSNQPTELDLKKPLIANGFYPDFLHQIMRSYVPGRSGDMILFPAADYHFGKAPRFGWRLGYHRGSHGGPFPEEVVVAAAYRGFVYNDNEPVRSAELLRQLGLIT